MKRQWNAMKSVIFSVMFMLLVSAALSLAAGNPAANNGPGLTAKQAQQLVASAKTAGDHEKLAEYFSQQAASYEAEAANHEAMIGTYRRNAVMFSRPTLEGTRMMGHCNYLVKSNREMAAAARESAATHEAMAKDSAK